MNPAFAFFSVVCLLSRRHVSQRILFTSYDFAIYFRQRLRASEVNSSVMATSLRINSSYFHWSKSQFQY